MKVYLLFKLICKVECISHSSNPEFQSLFLGNVAQTVMVLRSIVCIHFGFGKFTSNPSLNSSKLMGTLLLPASFVSSVHKLNTFGSIPFLQQENRVCIWQSVHSSEATEMLRKEFYCLSKSIFLNLSTKSMCSFIKNPNYIDISSEIHSNPSTKSICPFIKTQIYTLTILLALFGL